jgi:hypothetical protein
MNGPSIVAFVILSLLLLAGCVRTTQWWRVGSCLVLLEPGEERQLVVVGQGCDIKRDNLTAQGSSR